MSAVRVAVFAFEGASLFHLSVPAMVLSALNGTPSLPRYEVRYFAQSPGRMRSDHGVVIEVSDGLQALRRADIVIVPAWHDPETAAPAEVTDALRKAHKQGKLIVGLCLGAFVLADAGCSMARRPPPIGPRARHSLADFLMSCSVPTSCMWTMAMS